MQQNYAIFIKVFFVCLSILFLLNILLSLQVMKSLIFLSFFNLYSNTSIMYCESLIEAELPSFEFSLQWELFPLEGVSELWVSKHLVTEQNFISFTDNMLLCLADTIFSIGTNVMIQFQCRFNIDLFGYVSSTVHVNFS